MCLINNGRKQSTTALINTTIWAVCIEYQLISQVWCIHYLVFIALYRASKNSWCCSLVFLELKRFIVGIRIQSNRYGFCLTTPLFVTFIIKFFPSGKRWLVFSFLQYPHCEIKVHKLPCAIEIIRKVLLIAWILMILCFPNWKPFFDFGLHWCRNKKVSPKKEYRMLKWWRCIKKKFEHS